MNTQAKQILEAVRDGSISVDDALLELKAEPFKDIGFAKVDTHRRLRQGADEVIYGESKTTEQLRGIVAAMLSTAQKRVLITRLSEQKADELKKDFTLKYYEQPRLGIIGGMGEPDGIGRIVVAAAGTSDIPVAEEAVVTAEFFGNEVTRLYDVGVSGIHRLLEHKEDIMSAAVIIAVAGMEGALASVIGGLADCPVIAVPTSVGYGASFGGVAALLSMLNCCSAGVSVVNIDNGFGAGCLASKINHMEVRK